MPNPYPSTSTDIDIRVPANRVTTLLKEQHPARPTKASRMMALAMRYEIRGQGQ
jgi:hypothetical protein